MLQSSPPLLSVGISDQTRHSQLARVLAPSLSEVFMMQLVPVLLSICCHCYIVIYLPIKNTKEVFNIQYNNWL